MAINRILTQTETDANRAPWVLLMEYDLTAQRLQPNRTHASCYVRPAISVGAALHCFTPESPVPKQNYHQARKQRELARKARQQAKQERRSAHPLTPSANAAGAPAQTPTPRDPAGSGDGA